MCYSEDNTLSIIPDLTTPLSFCVNCGGVTQEFEDTTGIDITELTGSFATVWLGAPETIPENAKVIRVLPVCENDVKVTFILQNGETRTYYMKIKKEVASFKELTSFVKTIPALTGYNESTIEITEGENEVITTLFISGLRKNELDEISQLATSRYVMINDSRSEIIRKSAIISGNSQGGSFSIDLKGEV